MREQYPKEALAAHKIFQRLFIPELSKVIDAIAQVGGRAVAVGGAVRDAFRGRAPQDLDIEVFGLEKQQLLAALQAVGRVDEVGASFGIFKVSLKKSDGSLVQYDISLPRKEQKISAGHRGFFVTPDHLLNFEEAARRRDFTFNAMGYDFANKEFLDPFGGAQDLANGILRHVSDAFSEDPLRVLRAAQFAARFSCRLTPETVLACQKLKSELVALPKERIFGEIEKLLLAPKPSLGLTVLRETGALVLFPQLAALIGCEQEPQWHPEGDVWVHTLMVVDEAAKIVDEKGLESAEAFIIMLAALCHDLGKPGTTRREGERVRSKNHDIEGEKPTRSLLARLGCPLKYVEEIVSLVREHLKPIQLFRNKDNVGDAAIRRLSARVSIEKLCLVATADFLGRTTDEALAGHDPSTAWLSMRARDLDVEKCAPEPILMGRHLIDMGLQPGPQLGAILKAGYDEQIEGGFVDLEGARKWLHKNIKS